MASCKHRVLRSAAFALVTAFGVAQAQQPPTAQRLFFEAFEAFRQSHWDEAEARFRQGLALQPDNARAMLLLGDTLREKKDLRGARRMYLEAARRDAPAGSAGSVGPAGEIAQQARARLTDLPAPQFDLPPLPAKNVAAAKESFRNAVSLVKLPIERAELETAFALLEGLIDAGDTEGARRFAGPVAAAARLPADNSARSSFGGVPASHVDMVRELIRVGASQLRLSDAQGAARTVAQAEGVARAIRRLPDNEHEAKLTAVALTHVAIGYRLLGDGGNGSRVLQDALAAAARAEESEQSGVRTKMAIAFADADDLNAAWSMESLVRQRHPRFYVGNSWPDVLRVMAQQEMDAGHFDKAIELIVKGGEPVSIAFGFTDLIGQALAQSRPDIAENMAAFITHAEEKFEALRSISMFYAARHRKGDVRRMLSRLQEFSGTVPTLMLAPLYLYLGQPDRARQAFSSDTETLREAALTAMARARLALGDEGQAVQTVAVLDESALENARVELAMDCAATDADCTARLMRGVPVYRWGSILVARAAAGDFDGAAQLLALATRDAGTNAEAVGFLPGIAVELASELARMGYCDEALKYSAQGRSDAAYWTAIGRCQAGSPPAPMGTRRSL